MAKVATRKATPAKTPPKPAARTASSSSSKASQAAQHQGRKPDPEPPKPPAQPRQHSVPAVRQAASAPATSEAVSNLPAHMREFADMGKENIGRDDMQTPRLLLVQGTHTDLLSQYGDLKPGNFFHQVGEMIFDEPFRACVLYMDKRYILWRPLEDGGGILARADDSIHWSPGQGTFKVKLDRKDGGHEVEWQLAKTVQQSGLANWGTMNPNDTNSPPAATLMYNYLLAFPDHPELMPALFTLQRSGVKEAKAFNSKIAINRAPLFGAVYEFSTTNETNKNNQDYFGVSVKGAGLVEDTELFNLYHSIYKQYSEAGLSIKDIEAAQGDEAAGTDGDGNHPAM